MKKKYDRISILQLICLMVLLTGCANVAPAASSLSPERINELRQEYPAEQGFPPNIMAREIPFQQVLEVADAVIIAEVVQPNPNFHSELFTEPNTPEGALAEKTNKQNLSPAVYEFFSYQVRVEEVIYGETVENIIDLFYSSEMKGFEPELEAGMKIVTAIMSGTGDEQEGKYSYTRYGTYYIVDENYVLSAYEGHSEELTAFASQTNGKLLTHLIRTIKELTH
ncbi:hypothetical protein BK126_07015 [Paenibacillus sp. FSL H7-0326]|uniref:hypothetical protein n=1 Tax=Paenibacillus sp. FSL H7-0326 TaxID=1921144 RepID=UPI00096DEF3B|nr:hypothetical protein [Paenibacillus sp. FSL H7-0326]OMC71792.1 hypothetical protein BK126_07015 [Paenibacillus sp. FSL H7-0326]